MKFLKTFLLLILSLPFVSAYSPITYYLRTPSALLQSEWAMFILIFAIFFAVTFFAIGKTIKHKGAAAVASAAIAILISAAVSQRALYYGFFGESLSSWFLIIAVVIGFLMLLKVISSLFGGIGMLAVIFIGWFLIKGADISYYLPYAFVNSDLFWIFEFIASPEFGWVLAGITILIFLIAYGGKAETAKKFKNWLWGTKERKSALEILTRS